MRILSKTHDFYDGALAFGEDPGVVYLRDTREVFEPGDDLGVDLMAAPDTERRTVAGHRHVSYSPRLLLFCGRTYPFLVRRTYDVGNGLVDTSLWRAQDVHRSVEGHGGDLLASYGRRWRGTRFAGRSMRFDREDVETFMSTGVPERRAAAVHDRWSCPVILYAPSRLHGRYGVVATLDPVLKELGFQTVMDPYATYQSISQFVGGVLPAAAVDTVHLSDETRAGKHGFDRWSFRRPPVA